MSGYQSFLAAMSTAFARVTRAKAEVYQPTKGCLVNCCLRAYDQHGRRGGPVWPPAKKIVTHKGFVDVGTTGDHIGSPLRVFVNSPLNNNLPLHFPSGDAPLPWRVSRERWPPHCGKQQFVNSKIKIQERTVRTADHSRDGKHQQKKGQNRLQNENAFLLFLDPSPDT